MRTLVLVDGEHYPPVVRAAIESLPNRFPGCDVVAAALLGGGEKLAGVGELDLAIPIVAGDLSGGDPDRVLTEALARVRPDAVVDLSDQPVVDARTRLRLAARALLAGARYLGADFALEPPPRPKIARKPSIAVIATGKRTGKTAVASAAARTLAAQGRAPVIVAMGRGGPPEPELIDPAVDDLTPRGLLALADQGRHAASDHFEDAVTAGVATVGTRRCGGGLAGAPVDDTFAAGVEVANGRSEGVLVFEGSGQAIPPVHADATICVIPASADPELVTGYLGAYRVLLSDVIVITMADESLAHSGTASLERSVRGLAPGGARLVHTVFRPHPLEPISGKRVFYASTAPASAIDLMAGHLETEHGARIVGTSHHLADRPKLAADLEGLEGAEVLLVELKAAAIDLAARTALERGMEVIFCDNRPLSVGGDGSFEDLVRATADLAMERHST